MFVNASGDFHTLRMEDIVLTSMNASVMKPPVVNMEDA